VNKPILEPLKPREKIMMAFRFTKREFDMLDACAKHSRNSKTEVLRGLLTQYYNAYVRGSEYDIDA
jgi:hypothetical protein